MLNFVRGADRQKQRRREEVERREAARAEACARRETTKEFSDGLGPSPAVAAIRRGTSAHSDKSEEGPCLFEPSPVAVAVAVTSARELSEAKSAASTKTHFTAKSAGDATSTKFAAVIVPPIRAAIRTLTIARENPPRKRQKQSHGNPSCTLGK